MALQDIDHFFVLMLENRSFDHMLGFAGIPGVKALTGNESCAERPGQAGSPVVLVSRNAKDITDPDPPHEYRDVIYQLTGNRQGSYPVTTPVPLGYAASATHGLLEGESQRKKQAMRRVRGNGQYAMDCLAKGRVPVLTQLARDFVVCEKWYSSMPGPTWPNRFFAHAGTTDGLDNSPSRVTSVMAVLFNRLAFSFKNGTIFDRLNRKQGLGPRSWRIYHGDSFPQVLAIRDIVTGYAREVRLPSRLPRQNFRPLDQLFADVTSPEGFEPSYVFIEPNHDARHEARNGSSQHPVGRVSEGEKLIKYVYEALRASELWARCALIVTYDEHGGFFDREIPPAAIPPTTGNANHGEAEFPGDFKFDCLGVRVPAVVVSPWVESSEVVSDVVFDHTSILRTLEERFQLAPLSDRDAKAHSLGPLFSLPKARRTDPQTLPEPLGDSRLAPPPQPPPEDPVPPELAATVRIAASVDLLLDEIDFGLAAAEEKRANFRKERADRLDQPLHENRGQAEAYLRQVEARIKSEREPPTTLTERGA